MQHSNKVAMIVNMEPSWSSKELSVILEISDRAVRKAALSGKWPFHESKCNGGTQKKYYLSGLPSHIQISIVQKCEITNSNIQYLCPDAARVALAKLQPQRNMLEVVQSKQSLSISEGSVWNDDVARKEMIITEALNTPTGYKKSEWINHVAIKHDVNRATLYRWIDKRNRAGLAGLRHIRPNRNEATAWTREALDFWIGLVLKRSHRKIDKKQLYKALQTEASQRGWSIGSYQNALCWYKKRVTPQLDALQKGGIRALDNTLPPVLRDYSDLRPLEILVGDQHRFDFWVVDDVSGQVFRPECYLWQDLRTRIIYGGALDKKYNSYLIGLALRIGIKFFGMFEGIYTDNGKPELSHYVTGILKEKERLFTITEGIDQPIKPDMDDEEITCHIVSSEHTKAIVKNAKAKMIEGTFGEIERILRNFGIPGNVKRLSASGEEQDIDQEEINKLASSGQLLTFREFSKHFYNALAYYNQTKPHRGVLKEWKWLPKPKQATPADCFRAAMEYDRWSPVFISDETANILFLPKAIRTVEKGRVLLDKCLFEHEKLVPLNSQKVVVHYNPWELDSVLVSQNGNFICLAEPVEYSSMKDKVKASRLIGKKGRIRKSYVDEYRKLTMGVPDIRQYSLVPAAEKPLAVIGRDKRTRELENQECYGVLPQEEMDRRIAEQKAREESELKSRTQLQIEPTYFNSNYDRFECIHMKLLNNIDLTQEDCEFYRSYFLGRDEEFQRQRWHDFRSYGIVSKAATLLDPQNEPKGAQL